MPIVHLIGPRVSWRELTVDDAAGIVDLMSDPEVFRYASDQELPDLAAYETFLAEYLSTIGEPGRTRYKLGLVVDGELVGTGGLELSPSCQKGEIGYMLRSDHWGKGLGTEAAGLLVAYGFDELKLHRVWATAEPGNLASRRILEKIGMTYEGTAREDMFKDGEWRDSAVYAVLAGDPRPSVS